MFSQDGSTGRSTSQSASIHLWRSLLAVALCQRAGSCMDMALRSSLMWGLTLVTTSTRRVALSCWRTKLCRPDQVWALEWLSPHVDHGYGPIWRQASGLLWLGINQPLPNQQTYLPGILIIIGKNCGASVCFYIWGFILGFRGQETLLSRISLATRNRWTWSAETARGKSWGTFWSHSWNGYL